MFLKYRIILLGSQFLYAILKRPIITFNFCINSSSLYSSIEWLLSFLLFMWKINGQYNQQGVSDIVNFLSLHSPILCIHLYVYVHAVPWTWKSCSIRQTPVFSSRPKSCYSLFLSSSRINCISSFSTPKHLIVCT